MYSTVILSLIVYFFSYTNGELQCYTCGFSAADSDTSCLEITNDTQIVTCRFQYCTIMRQEFMDPRGVIASFSRNCLSSPDFLNHEVEDSTFRTYYRACTNNLCNIGDGIQSVTESNLSPRPSNRTQNLLVPGSAGTHVFLSSFLFTFSLILYVCT